MSKLFSYEERLQMQCVLKSSLSFKKIGRRLDKNPSTITWEVRKYSCEIATGYPSQAHNTCRNCRSCTRRRICGKDCSRRTLYCRYCNLCNTSCLDYVEEVCRARFRAPYIRNGCTEIGECSLVKTFYDAEKAHIRAHEVISDSRSGLCLNEREVIRLNRILSPMVNLYTRFMFTIRMN